MRNSTLYSSPRASLKLQLPNSHPINPFPSFASLQAIHSFCVLLGCMCRYITLLSQLYTYHSSPPQNCVHVCVCVCVCVRVCVRVCVLLFLPGRMHYCSVDSANATCTQPSPSASMPAIVHAIQVVSNSRVLQDPQQQDYYLLHTMHRCYRLISLSTCKANISPLLSMHQLCCH